MGAARRFKKFEASFHPETWARHDELLEWAEAQAEMATQIENDDRSDDPVVNQGRELLQKLHRRFKNSSRQYEQLRILMHVPPPTVSSAHASLGINFIQSFRFLGMMLRN